MGREVSNVLRASRIGVPPNHIQTFSGKVVDPRNMTADDICLKDIAHALSMICRFGGHTVHHYSVAQHCVLGTRFSELSDGGDMPAIWTEELMRCFLMHDGAEPYIGDIVRPLKRSDGIREVIEVAEHNIMLAIRERFNLSNDPRVWKAVGVIDNRMLFTEKRDILMHPNSAWSGFDVEPVPYSQHIKPMSPHHAEAEFLAAAEAFGIKD